MNPEVFIGSYTYTNKSYCDSEFINSLTSLTYENKTVSIVDNSDDRGAYLARLQELTEGTGFSVSHIDISVSPGASRPHESIVQSANALRDQFLSSEAEWLLLLESDVIPPTSTIEMFLEVADSFDIIGAVYYRGYHPDAWFLDDHTDPVPRDNPCRTILSGCTMYSRRVIETVKFRYDAEFLAPFPDAWISIDAAVAGFTDQCDYTKIVCKHAHNSSGERGW